MNKKIVVIGTGYVGLPAALMWAKSGQKVVGVDINENVVRAIEDRVMLINEEELKSLMSDDNIMANLIARTTPTTGDVFVIAVPTPVDSLKKVADLSYVIAAIRSICPFLEAGNLVIVESTVPPMTCRKIIQPLIEEKTKFKVPEDILLAHCPERILPGNIFHEIVHNDRLIGGVNRDSAKFAAEVYASFVKGQLYQTDDLTAELAKLMENTYRDVNIALAYEFASICEDLQVDANMVIGYANKHPRVNILKPGIGVGGHCIPVDPWFLKEVSPYNSRLISTARLINDEMPQCTAAKIRKAVSGLSMPKIAAIGATYKKDCEDLRESPANKVVAILRSDGYDVQHFDPLVPSMKYGTLLEVAQHVDALIFLVAHSVVLQEWQRDSEAIMEAMRSKIVIFFDD